ncbi:glycosyltransferase [Rhizobium sp. FY34]|uniref:glycosyltransferase family protein n=1 Tax=Rhizobium sp. FY34 TaxID=2562309 RepID=UPI0010C00297|nr:glycosyltransferase [Rhizobium sp. FY34]
MGETSGHLGARPKRVFFYVQHLLGIGHLVRASRIANALNEAGMDVTLVTGGNKIDGFPAANVRHVQLPPVFAASSGFSGLADEQGHKIDDAFKAMRKARLLEAFEKAAPDAVLIEAFPFGRRQMHFELLPLMEAIEASNPRPLLFSSVRDILQENRKAGRDEETVTLAKRYFDGVLVHGDESFVRLEETFPLAREIAERVHYTGLVAPDEPAPATDHFDVVVSAGGGAVGASVLQASLEACKILADRRSWLLIAGPNMPAEDFERLNADAPETVTIVRFRRDFSNLLMNAQVSISQAGYNTVGDLLRARCACVLLPFSSGGETEQTVRAEKLQALGFAEMVTEDELTGESLALAIRRATEPGKARPALALSLDGARQTAALIDRLVAEKRSTAG